MMGRHTVALCLVLIACAAAWTTFAQVSKPSQKIILGILEDVPGNYAGQADVRAVRVAFQRQGEDWQAFPSNCRNPQCLQTISSSYPETVTWTITFQGKSLGQIVATTRKTLDAYSHVGLQDIVDHGPIPTVGQKSERYAGFLWSPVYRPLIASSQPFFEDRDKWAASHLPPELVSAVRREFRRHFPRAVNCKNPEENTSKPWAYRDENITPGPVYSSHEHWYIVQATLGPYRCDGPPDDGFWGQWFVITPNNEITLLGKAMQLLGSGDYDNDGKSEVIFSPEGYDVGGYELFYDNFKKHATFEFIYH
jgi:hypothetical protein